MMSTVILIACPVVGSIAVGLFTAWCIKDLDG